MAWKLSDIGRERYAILAGEWVTVEAGRVLVVNTVGALILDGVLRLDGVVKVG